MPIWLSRTIPMSKYFSESRPLRHNEVQLYICSHHISIFMFSSYINIYVPIIYQYLCSHHISIFRFSSYISIFMFSSYINIYVLIIYQYLGSHHISIFMFSSYISIFMFFIIYQMFIKLSHFHTPHSRCLSAWPVIVCQRTQVL